MRLSKLYIVTISYLTLIHLCLWGCTSPIALKSCDRDEDCRSGQICSISLCVTPEVDLGLVEFECIQDEDCGENQRCVNGACFQNSCQEGERRGCLCDTGEQVCEGGVWRTCSATRDDVECDEDMGISDQGIEMSDQGIEMSDQGIEMSDQGEDSCDIERSIGCACSSDEPCDADEGLICQDGVCTAEEEDPCEVCPTGSRCNDQGRCEPSFLCADQPMSAGCDTGRTCVEGYGAWGDRCVMCTPVECERKIGTRSKILLYTLHAGWLYFLHVY